jgi:hypothetical protein
VSVEADEFEVGMADDVAQAVESDIAGTPLNDAMNGAMTHETTSELFGFRLCLKVSHSPFFAVKRAIESVRQLLYPRPAFERSPRGRSAEDRR